MKYNTKQIDQVISHFYGTCNNVYSSVDTFGFDITGEDIEEILVNANVEICEGCGWWFESGELVNLDDDTQIGCCEDCR